MTEFRSPCSFFSRTRSKVAACAIFAGLTLLSSVPEAAAQEAQEPAEEAKMVAVIKLPPPKQLSEKILGVARKVQPGPQVEALPFMLGGMLGDPMLEGVSAAENFGIAIMMQGDVVAPVLILQLTEDSPLRESLPGFDLQLVDAEGWTFGVTKDFSLSLVKGQEQSLIDAIKGPRQYDIEFKAETPLLAKMLREFIEESAKGGEDNTDDQMMRSAVKTVSAESESVSDLRIGLNLSPEIVDLIYFMEGSKGSPLAALLNQERPKDLSFGKLISADGGMAYLGGFDTSAVGKYVDHIFGSLTSGVDKKTAESLENIRSITHQYLQSTTGASGGVMSMSEETFEMVQIAPSKMSDKQLVDLLQTTTKGISEMLSVGLGEEMKGLIGSTSQKVIVNKFKVDDIPVHVVRAESKGPPVEDSSDSSPSEVKTQVQEVNYAVAGGFLLGVSDESKMTALIQTVKKGEPVANNLVSVIPLAEDILGEIRIDLVRYARGILGAKLTPEQANAMQRLEDRGLPPLRGTVSARGGKGEARLHIPVDTIVAAYQASMESMAEEDAELEEMPAPSQP